MIVKIQTKDGRTLSFEGVNDICYEGGGKFLALSGSSPELFEYAWTEVHNTENIESYLVIYDKEEDANDA